MHPILSVFETTAQQTFPLILVIGREPNTHEPTQPTIGAYDFRQHPRCGFWNMSYRFVANAMTLQGRDLKALCIQRASSPIIYADILPISLPNHVTSKYTHRAQVTPAAIEGHVSAIFAHTSLLARVDLVLFSGLHDPVFTRAREACARACAERSIPVWSVPFFHGVNSRHLRTALTPELQQHVCSVVSPFRAIGH